MLVNFSTIKDLPIVSLDQEVKVGSVLDLAINPQDGKILCLLIKTGFFSPKLALLPQDILKWEEEFILIQNNQSLIPVEEIVRVQEILKQHFKWVDQKVVNTQKRKIGKVLDLTLDLEIGQISRLSIEITSLKGLLETERLIPWNKIIKVTPHYIMIEELEKSKGLKELADEII